MPLAELPPNRLAPDHHQILLDALERARREVCCYSPFARTCDCKYGLVLPTDPAAVVPLNAPNCTHRHCEHTGCPEIRELIHRVRNAQRAAWARRSARHARTSHGWACCVHHLAFNPDADNPAMSMYDGTFGGETCGGPYYCHTCSPEADRIHGLLPSPPEVADDSPPA